MEINNWEYYADSNKVATNEFLQAMDMGFKEINDLYDRWEKGDHSRELFGLINQKVEVFFKMEDRLYDTCDCGYLDLDSIDRFQRVTELEQEEIL